MLVTDLKKTVLGIRCTVVRDTVSKHGTPIERTGVGEVKEEVDVDGLAVHGGLRFRF